MNLKSTEYNNITEQFFPNELSQKLSFSYPSLQPKGVDLRFFQITNYLRLKDLSLQYLRSTPLGYKDIGLGKSKLVARPQFLYGTVQDNAEMHLAEVSDAD